MNHENENKIQYWDKAQAHTHTLVWSKHDVKCSIPVEDKELEKS